MTTLIHDCISEQAARCPHAIALQAGERQVTYAELEAAATSVASGLQQLGVGPGDRIAVFLPKLPETVFALFGSSYANACFVPINPLLKPRQVLHILDDCDVKVLITSSQRLQLLTPTLPGCRSLGSIILVEEVTATPSELPLRAEVLSWSALGQSRRPVTRERIDQDIAAILYTSGSTGKPKGVVLSHGNLVAGARSVAEYTHTVAGDRLLAVLPLSFDAGLSQLTTAFVAGARVVLLDYLLPGDVIKAVCHYRVTGLAAVPPLWNKLSNLDWPPEAAESLRFVSSTGGAMPVATTRTLQKKLPDTDIYLMYGLTESFRSTYLPPDQVTRRPDSIGRAIPNAEILVINNDGPAV